MSFPGSQTGSRLVFIMVDGLG